MEEMIVVSKIELLKYPKDRMLIWKHPDLLPCDYKNKFTPLEVGTEIEQEIIKGNRFYLYDHETGNRQLYVIGYSKQVQDALKIPMDSFEELIRENMKLNKSLETYQTMKFWDKFKFLFGF